MTLLVALGGGVLAGVAMLPFGNRDVHMGDDSAYWHVASDFMGKIA